MVGVTGVIPRISRGFKSIIPCVLMGAHDLPEDMLGACTATRSAGEVNKWDDIQNSQAVPLDNGWLFKSSTVCFQYWLPCDVERPSLSRGFPTRCQYD